MYSKHNKIGDVMKSRRFEERVAEVLNAFDFEFVVETMRRKAWRWFFPGEPARTPTAGEVRAEARRLLEMLYAEDDGYLAECGGLRASREAGGIWLEFIAEWGGA